MWDLPENQVQFETEFNLIKESGFSAVILRGFPTTQQLFKFDEAGLGIIIDSGLQNVHRNVIRNDQERFDQTIRNYLNHYGSQSSVKGIVLLSHGAFYNDDFSVFMENIARTITSEEPSWNVYVVTNHTLKAVDSSIAVIETSISRLSEVQDGSNVLVQVSTNPNSVRHIRDQLDDIISLFSGNDVWFKDVTLIQAMLENPSLIRLFYTYNTQTNPVFPAEVIKVSKTKINWEIPLLFFLLISYLLFFRYVLSYKKTLFRYFNSNTFFVSDILERVVLLGKTVFFLLPVFGLLFAHIIMVSIFHIFGEGGMDVLKYHYTAFSDQWLVFLYAFLGFLIFNVLSIGWIASAAWRKEIISQAGVLVLWPQHILIPLSFISLVVAMGGYNPILSLIVLIFAVLFIPISFMIASANFSSKPTFRPLIHKLLTVVLGVVVFITVILLIHYKTDVTAVFELALYNTGIV